MNKTAWKIYYPKKYCESQLYRSTRLSATTNWKNCTVCINRYDKLNMIFFNSISVFKTITAKQKMRTVFYKLVWTLYTPEIVHQSDARALSFLFPLSRAKGSSIIDDIRVPSLLYLTVHSWQQKLLQPIIRSHGRFFVVVFIGKYFFLRV